MPPSPPDPVELIAELFPKDKRPAARAKVRKAVAMGWGVKDIRITTPDGETPDPMELIGRHPISGKMTLLPEVED